MVLVEVEVEQVPLVVLVEEQETLGDPLNMGLEQVEQVGIAIK